MLLEHRSLSLESSFSSTFLFLSLTLIFLFQESLVRAAERREQTRDQGGRGDERVGQTPQENWGQRSERAGDRSPLEPELLWRSEKDDHRRGAAGDREHCDHPPLGVGPGRGGWRHTLEHGVQERVGNSSQRLERWRLRQEEAARVRGSGGLSDLPGTNGYRESQHWQQERWERRLCAQVES